MDVTKKGWHSRGYLPHFDGDVTQFVTYRLFDSLPQSLLRRFKTEAHYDKLTHYYDDAFVANIEKYLDRGLGSCFLRDATVAAIVRRALQYQAGRHLKLISWVIMPNHVHFLSRMNDGSSLPDVMRDLKGFTAREANKTLKRTGPFWQPDYFDRYIRTEQHFLKTIAYIENNPVEAGLCDRPEDWEFSSVWNADRFERGRPRPD